MVNTEIRLIMFFAAKDGEALYSQQKQDQKLSMCNHYVSQRNKTWLATQDEEGNGNPLQYSCLENPMDGEAWYAAVHGVAKSRTRLSDFTFTFHFHALEKDMATHSSILAWRVPGT